MYVVAGVYEVLTLSSQDIHRDYKTLAETCTHVKAKAGLLDHWAKLKGAGTLPPHGATIGQLSGSHSK